MKDTGSFGLTSDIAREGQLELGFFIYFLFYYYVLVFKFFILNPNKFST